jgi:hypothetical protein
MQRELAQRERAGLVTAEDIHVAKVFDRREPLHHHLIARHAERAVGQGDRDDGRQHLGCDPDGQSHGEQERIEPALAEQRVGQEHEHRQQQDDAHQEAAEPADVALEVALRQSLLEQPGAPAEERGAPGGVHDAVPVAAHHRRAEVRPVTRGLGHRHRLPGERCLVGGEVLGGREDQVGRDLVAHLEQHQVALHHLGGGDLDGRAAPPYPRRAGDQPPERRQRALGAVLLHEAQQGVERHDEQDHRRVHRFAEQPADAGNADEYQHERARELAAQDAERRAARACGDFVGAVLCQPTRGLVGGQPGAIGRPGYGWRCGCRGRNVRRGHRRGPLVGRGACGERRGVRRGSRRRRWCRRG